MADLSARGQASHQVWQASSQRMSLTSSCGIAGLMLHTLFVICICAYLAISHRGSAVEPLPRGCRRRCWLWKVTCWTSSGSCSNWSYSGPTKGASSPTYGLVSCDRCAVGHVSSGRAILLSTKRGELMMGTNAGIAQMATHGRGRQHCHICSQQESNLGSPVILSSPTALGNSRWRGVAP